MATPSGPERLHLDARDLDDEARRAWSELADRALEPNPYFRPEFALANLAERGVPLELLVVRSGSSWLACLPVRRRGRSSRLPVSSLEAMTDDYSFLGTPLIDRDRVVAGVDGLLDLVAAERSAGVVVLGVWPRQGAVSAAFSAAATARRLRPIELSSFERAAWHRAPDGSAAGARLTKTDRRHLASRWKRLTADLGAEPTMVDRSREPEAWDRFLALENSGWKAHHGNPMAAVPKDAAFFRRIARDLSDRGHFELVTFEAAGRTIAAETHLVDGTALYSFKIAHDPAFRDAWPGKQMKVRVLDSFAGRGLELADSCTAPGNINANRMWPGRRAFVTLLLPTGAMSGRLVRPLVAGRSTARRVRDQVRDRRRGGPDPA